eukprot:TRINITY_DN13793_c0_g1_i3.p1 TRINITY_DN13793_c0_g1~~TRINITY_DN13793_c0_g1_i3.p1  ORF type:complete len:184 (-),score=29.67 TRINITY_DN13793_c0_g1_i3:396-890(-)
MLGGKVLFQQLVCKSPKGFLTQRVAAPLQRKYSGVVMAQKQVISTEKAPAALGPYSQAIKTGNMLFVSGQIGLIPESMEFGSGEVEVQAEQVMKNMGAVLQEAGSDYSKVIKTTILLEDINDFVKVNEVYGKYFPENPPARSTFAVKSLPKGAKVEIEAIALID